MKKILLFVFTLVGAALACPGAFAETVQSAITVSPPNQKLELKPGEVYQGSITVSNGNSSTIASTYNVSVGSFSQVKTEESRDDYGSMDSSIVSEYNQIVDWITISEKEGTLKPNSANTIHYTITVPENAPAGGQYATILVADAGSDDNGENANVNIQSKYQIASIIYAKIDGQTQEKADVLLNSMSGFLMNGPLVAESMVKNEGNVHTEAEYTLQVWPLFSGEEICTNVDNPDRSLILPGTERYHAQSCDLPAVGIFRAKQEVKIFDKISVLEQTIIVCPLWLMFIVIFVVIALVLWIITIIIKRKKHGQN